MGVRTEFTEYTGRLRLSSPTVLFGDRYVKVSFGVRFLGGQEGRMRICEDRVSPIAERGR